MSGGAAWVNGYVAYSEIIGVIALVTVALASGSYNDLSNKPNLVDDISDLLDVDTVNSPQYWTSIKMGRYKMGTRR